MRPTRFTPQNSPHQRTRLSVDTPNRRIVIAQGPDGRLTRGAPAPAASPAGRGGRARRAGPALRRLTTALRRLGARRGPTERRAAAVGNVRQFPEKVRRPRRRTGPASPGAAGSSRALASDVRGLTKSAREPGEGCRCSPEARRRPAEGGRHAVGDGSVLVSVLWQMWHPQPRRILLPRLRRPGSPGSGGCPRDSRAHFRDTNRAHSRAERRPYSSPDHPDFHVRPSDLHVSIWGKFDLFREFS